MTQMLKRALPFILTFVLGVMITAIIGRISPIRHTWSYEGRGHRCGKSQTVDVWELRDSATVLRIPMTVRKSHLSMFTIKEQALLTRASQDVAHSGPGFVIDYVSPEAIDGRPYTSHVTISNIPRPAFWDNKQLEYKPTLTCNSLFRVDLDASGTVSNVEAVIGSGGQCPYFADFVEAAKQISFTPALRDGVPVTVRMSVMYRARYEYQWMNKQPDVK